MIRSRLDVMTLRAEAVGTFLPLGAIVQQEGGYDHPENIQAALCYVRRAIQLHTEKTADKIWARWNEVTQQAEFLYIHCSHSSLRSSFGIAVREDVASFRASIPKLDHVAVGHAPAAQHSAPRVLPP